MNPFVYTAHPLRVVFEDGARRRAPEEVDRLGRKRAMVICTPEQREQAHDIASLLGERCAGVLDAAVMHTPVEVTERALTEMQAADADCTVAVGGGSTIGLAKALALRADYPQIAVPTTYAGSEMTTILGQTENGVKTTLKDASVLPVTVIYDVDYTLSLPVNISATSGMNAIAHAIEALYAQEKNPISTLQCLEAIKSLSEALPVIAQSPTDRAARQKALYGAFLCGMALGSAGMALHHKLCHTLGGTFDLPHAQTHTVVLPHAAGFNADSCDGALAPVATMLGSEGPGKGLWQLAKRINAPTSLAEIGMPADGIDKAADIATANPYWNPRPFDRDDIVKLLQAAHQGECPTG